MYPASAAAQAALKSSHRIATCAEVYDSGLPTGITLNIVNGQVSVDAGSAVRRSCQLTVVDPTGALVPSTAADALSPYGNELAVYRGVTFANGVQELIPLGIFRISTPEVSDDGAVQIALTGYDRARTIARNQFTATYAVLVGTNYVDAIVNLLSDRLPNLTIAQAVPTTQTTPLLTFDAGSDPWDAASSMADAIGYEVFFDVMGAAVIRPVPAPVDGSVPVWTYANGVNSTLISVKNSLTDDPGYNGVIVLGEASSISAPVRGEAWDANPLSPTYYLGDYGKVPYVTTSPYVSTQDQANQMAQALLIQMLGGTEQVEFSAVPNPLHEAGDLVQVTRARAKVSDVYVIESFTIPLSADQEMGVTTRRRRTAA